MMQQLMPRILFFPSLSNHICNINHLTLLDFQISRHPDFKHYPISEIIHHSSIATEFLHACLRDRH